MKTRTSLDDIATWLDERPDVIVVHMSIGGNDWVYSGWGPSWADTAAERDLIARIIQRVEIVVDHIFSLRPDVQILWQAGDFPRPYSQGTPAEINTFLITFAEQKAQFAAIRPGLNFVDTLGTLQVTYGFDGVQHTPFDPGFVIPPGDPSLPDPGFPSPYEPFIPNEPFHKTPEGNKVLAQAQYDLFYGPLLNDQDFQINAGMSDAWSNPDTSGQGFFISVFPDIQYMFLAWFTFDTERPDESVSAILGEPGHRWLVAEGKYADNQAVLDAYYAVGGLFDTPTPELERKVVGTMIVEFTDCSAGTITYDIPDINRQGVVPIQRVWAANAELCEALQDQLLQQ